MTALFFALPPPPPPPPPPVKDLVFQLERMVAGLYVYTRQCYKALKPAAVFPIEVQLGPELLTAAEQVAAETVAVEAVEEKEEEKEEEEEKERVVQDGAGDVVPAQDSNGGAEDLKPEGAESGLGLMEGDLISIN